jgi:hypothetical protein
VLDELRAQLLHDYLPTEITITSGAKNLGHATNGNAPLKYISTANFQGHSSTWA